MTYFNNKKLYLPFDVDPNIYKYKRKIIGGGQSCFVIGSKELSNSVNMKHIDNFRFVLDDCQIIHRNKKRMFNPDLFEKIELNNEKIFQEIRENKFIKNEIDKNRKSFSSNNNSMRMRALLTYEYANC